MSAYLINGPSTSGKTSIGAELEQRGYEVIDTDKAFGYYANLATEKPVEFPESGYPSEDWYRTNGWIWNRIKVEKALDEATDKPVFFCGGALNESTFYPRFSKIFRLHIESDILTARLENRSGDRHTNNPVFRDRMLSFLRHSEKDARKLGWTVINTSHQSARESANQILSYVHEG